MSELSYLWKNFLNMQGRCGPSQFWRAALPLNGIAALMLTPYLLSIIKQDELTARYADFLDTDSIPKALSLTAWILYMMVVVFGGLMLIIMSHALCQRRMNDIGIGGKLPEGLNLIVRHFLASCTLLTLTATLSGLIASMHPLGGLLAFILSSGFGSIFIFGNYRSQPETNPYGPNPTEATP